MSRNERKYCFRVLHVLLSLCTAAQILLRGGGSYTQANPSGLLDIFIHFISDISLCVLVEFR